MQVIINGGGNHFLLRGYEKVFTTAKFGGQTGAAVSKVVFDQLVYTTVCYVPVYQLGTRMLRGKSFSEAYQGMEAAYIDSVKTSWAVMGPGQMFNFMFVPQHLRVAFVCLVGLTFNTGLAALSCLVDSPRPHAPKTSD